MAKDKISTTTLPGRPEVEVVYEYKNIQWKNFFTKKKYIREYSWCTVNGWADTNSLVDIDGGNICFAHSVHIE